MNDARRCCITQSVAGSATSNTQMQGNPCKLLINGFAGAYVCAYGKVGNYRRHACAILANAEYQNGVHINGVMRVRGVGQWQVALWKSQRALETSREQAIRHCWDTTKSIIVDKEPPYADPHVRWCERSENKSRRKTYFCFPPTRLSLSVAAVITLTLELRR